MVYHNKMPTPGELISERYRVESQIGRGGFGVVYKATQTGLQREVALKVLLPAAMLKEEMVERFRREAVLARNLNHPNTIRLYDFGQSEDGLLYIAMEFLRGRPLDRIVKEGPLEPERVQHIAAQILKSLAEAHQHNIIHRDIKPSNIFVCDDVVGEPDFVKVLDFGIAKAFGESDDSRLTQTGMGFGTPFYMAPEQIRAKGICPATDLYALGLMMVEMLTGKTVYDGESSMDIAVKQLSEEPPPVPEWVLRGPLGPVLQRATQKDVHMRYPSAVEMLRDLRSVDTHASIDVSAKLDARELTQDDEGPNRKPLFIAIFALMLLMFVGLGVGVFVITQMMQSEAPGQERVEGGDNGEDAGSALVGEGDSVRGGETPDAGEAGGDEPDKLADADKVKVTVNSQPPGASVYHGEEYLGTTPVVVPFDPDESGVTLRVEKETFEEVFLPVTLKEDGEYNVELQVMDEVVLGEQLKGAQQKDEVKPTATRPTGGGKSGARATGGKSGGAKSGGAKAAGGGKVSGQGDTKPRETKTPPTPVKKPEGNKPTNVKIPKL